MRKCSVCGQVYIEDHDYCLNDGTPLDGSSGDYFTPTRVIPTPYPGDVLQRTTGTRPWVYVTLGGLATALVVAVAVIFFIGSRGYTDDANRVAPVPKNSVAVTADISPAVTSPTRTATTPNVPRPSLGSYPATTRLKFSRGAVSISFSGEINPDGSRSFVLACRPGQTLTASISSAGDCISFSSGGSTRLSSTTAAGDNFLSLTNRCSGLTRFTLNVTDL